MRKAGTVAGTNSIDAAFVIGQVKELAGLTLVQPIALAIFIQPFFAECIGGHTKMCGYALDICQGVSGRHGLAAIGAGQAIRLLPYRGIGLYHH